MTEESAVKILEELKTDAINLVNGIYSDDLDGKSALDILTVALQRLEGIHALMRHRVGGVN